MTLVGDAAQVHATDSAPLAPASVSRSRRPLIIEALVLLAAGVLLPVAIAAHYGSLGVPGSDDWSFDLAAFKLASSGHLYLFHWARMTLVGQLVLAVPVIWMFGPHVWALNLETCLLGWGGLMSVSYLARRLGASRRMGVFIAACVGLGPMWSTLSTTFMADVPAVSVMLMAIALAASDRGTRMLTHRSATALLLAGVAFTIRDQAGAGLIVIAVGRLLRAGRPRWSESRSWVLFVAAVGVAMAAFFVWRQGVPSAGGPLDGPPTSLARWWSAEWLFPLLGLSLVPIAVAIHPLAVIRSAWRESRPAAVAVWTLMPVGPMLFHLYLDRANLLSSQPVSGRLSSLAPDFGNFYFVFRGFLPGDSFEWVSPWTELGMGLLSALALVTFEALGVLTVRTVISRHRMHRRPGDQGALLVTLAAGTSAAVVAFHTLTGYMIWDRYVLFLTPFATLLTLRMSRVVAMPVPPQARTGGGPLLALTGLAIIATLTTVAADGAVGSEWSYSRAFAATVPSVPKARIATAWFWNSTNNLRLTYESTPGYMPCYRQVNADQVQPGMIFVRDEGSWLVPYRWAMEKVSSGPCGGQPASG